MAEAVAPELDDAVRRKVLALVGLGVRGRLVVEVRSGCESKR